MSIVSLLLVLVIVGVALAFIPMEARIKNIAVAIVAIFAVIALIKLLVPGALAL